MINDALRIVITICSGMCIRHIWSNLITLDRRIHLSSFIITVNA